MDSLRKSFCGIFLTERNFVVLTYDLSEKEESLKYSILTRLLQVLGTNILPIGILIVGIGEYNEKVTKYIEKKIVYSLKKIQKFLNKLVDSQINELINLSEKIELILETIDFGVIPNKKNFDELWIIKPKLANSDTNIKWHLDEIQKISSIINEKDLGELKSFKAPPSAVQNVAEAMCYLFAKQANYQNFAKLLNTDNFIEQIKNFDLNLINDYKLKNLEKYIQMPDFDGDTIANFSRPASILCNWIHSVYNYGLAAENEDKSKDSTTSSITNIYLKDYLFEKSFYMFKWNLYYEDKYENSEKEIDELIKKSIDLKNEPILTIDELNQLFLANEKLKEYQSNQFKQLSLRYARAQNARGRFFFNEKTKFIITDLIWLKSIFDILANKETNESHLNDILGTGIPVWNINELKEELQKLCPTDQIFDYLISFLKENSLIILTDKEEIIPIFCLSKNQDSAFEKWSDKWSDLEYKVSWELFSPLPFNVFSEFVSMFFDSRTCIKLRKNGFLYQDTHFDALVRYSEREVNLSVRMIDPERYFNLAERSFMDHFKTAYMNFHIYLRHLLIKYHVPHRLKLEEFKLNHPIQIDNDEHKILTAGLGNKKFYLFSFSQYKDMIF
ncbi:dynein heavy chain axonemal [Brachionus plicatilis]|uniref:Dynein heavy chain axonemal n=1 Tax=Brachionus plicatilis TaxID=10195 RepID=A0A3M7Q261_BRAPC|nr:dynein heavy chain axonemal [Brachionus plicatilis]